MDFFCQKCTKPLELHESLLDIDQSMFIGKDNDDVLNLVKILQEKLTMPPGSAASSANGGTLKNTQSLASIMSQSIESQSGSNLSGTLSYNGGQISQSNHANNGGHLTKFKTGLFNRKRDPQLARYHQSQPQLQNALQQQTAEQQSLQKTKQQPITIDSSSTTATSGVGTGTGTSPSSFGSLSQHRMSVPSSLSSSSSISSNVNSSKASSSFEGEQIALGQSVERAKSLKQPLSNSSKQSLKSSTTLTSPVHGSRVIHSPQQKSISKLKYMRANAKSQSLASLPKYQSAIELSMSPPPTNNNNNINSNTNQQSRVSGVMSPPIQQHYTTTPNTPLQQHHSNQMAASSNVVSPIGSPPLTHNNAGSIKYHQSMSLFRLVTELINTDFPMCMECSKLAIGDLELENKEVIDEIDVYQKTIDSLAADTTNKDLAALDKQIAKLEEEERFYFGALEKAQRDRQYIANISNDLARRREQLDLLEQRYWSAYSEHQGDSNRLNDDQASIVTQTGVAMDKLRRLKETNILNDAFHLWHDGHFGTINGLRLGRLQSQPVEWNEINSAWGLAISLLDNLAKKLNYKFKQFRLIPNGSTSKIEDVANKAVYELYGSSDISLGRLFWYGRFDNGMVSFLQCLKELTEHVKTVHDPEFEVPYTIENGHINRMLIKMQFTDEDTWTKALKYMLTNLKWLLSWVAKNESTQPMNINVKRQPSTGTPSTSTNNSQSSSPNNVSTLNNTATNNGNGVSSLDNNNNNNNNSNNNINNSSK